MASSVVNELRQIGERLARIETAILEIQAGPIGNASFEDVEAELNSALTTANSASASMPPEVEAAIAVRFSGDIAAAQQTRTVALSRLQHGMSAEKVREEVLGLGEIVE